ncbi:MAG TPA: DoxX family protein [bacterium]|nr:DoxX family protein [bacterium]
MKTNAAIRQATTPVIRADRGGGAWRYLVPLGRLAFAAVFVLFAPLDFTPQGVVWAGQQGIPLAQVLVPLAGLIGLAGGLSVILGYRARIGARLLILFLVPVTVTMHNFWAVRDPMMAQMQVGFFLANLSRIGACLLIAYFGAGPLSIDARIPCRGPWTAARPAED